MIFIVVTIIICIILFIYVSLSDNFSLINIKLKNIEEKINSTLINRKTLLMESEDIIKEALKTKKQVYEDIDKLNNANISIMELDRKLLVYINEFYLIKDKYKKLKNNDSFQKIAYKIEQTEDLLDAYKEYYNIVTSKYNKYISTFPISIISFIKGRKEKKFFDKNNIDY